MFFKKKKKYNVKEITLRIIKETQLCNECLQLIKNSGEYKKRKLYNISNDELAEKIANIRAGFIAMQTNVILAEVIITEFNLYAEYEKLLTAINLNIDEKLKTSKGGKNV